MLFNFNQESCYFEKKRAHACNVARLLSTSVFIEKIKMLVASWLVAKLPGGEMTGNQRNNSLLIYIYIHVSRIYSKFAIRMIKQVIIEDISFQGKLK